MRALDSRGMRTLFLLRHATPELEPFDRDRARELSALGRRQAFEVGEVLRDRGIEHVLCSSAVRTQQTLAALQLGDSPAVEVLDKLYMCGTNTLLQRIGEVVDGVQSLLVVAHSPTIPGLAARIASGAHPKIAEDLWASYPPATLTEFSVDGPWDALTRMPYALGQLVDVRRP